MDTCSSILNFLECISDESHSVLSRSFYRSKDKIEMNDDDDEIINTEREYTNENFDSNLDDTSEIILSVYWKRGKLGGAYYICNSAELYLLNDVVDVHSDFCNLKTFINQVQPSQILSCGGSSDLFVKCLKDLTNETSESSEDSVETSRKLVFMSTKKKDLGYDSCKRHILGLRLGFEPEMLSEEDHILFMNSLIDMGQESMVVSLGMLVKYLEKYLPQMTLNHHRPHIMFLKQVALENLVSVNDNTYKALQIFNPRVHPSAFKRNSYASNKEGLSVFGVFSRCKSAVGLKKMREFFVNPKKNIEELEERLDAVEFCTKPQHQHIIQNIVDCIKKVESVTGLLMRIYRTQARMSHWRSLYNSLHNAILIGEICQKHSASSRLLERVAKSITPNIHEVTHYISRIVDLDESNLKINFTVRDGVDRKLDLLRQTYAQIPEVLIKVAKIELEDLPSFIERCSIIYITELGYLLSVPIWRGDGNNISEYSLPNFEAKFIVNRFVHYKTPRCSELDNVLGDSIASISNIESRIMISLIQFIHKRISDIVKIVDLIAELDCVISLAVVASENNYRRPILTLDRKLEIIQGRHPLQELCVDNFVPNDVKFGSEDGYIKILTGPNASGKSVYLKQVALIAYLAHIGSFVPAQSAVIGILDHIHSRVQSVESISTRMSAFLLDLQQMSNSLYNSTPRSLIIIDEFGKGTTEIDGLSLFASSLIHFIERKECCPYVLASTHFHQLPQLLPPTPLVHLQYMNYLIENEEIVYLHKIKEGTCEFSLTNLAAKAAGLAEGAVKRSVEASIKI